MSYPVNTMLRYFPATCGSGEATCGSGEATCGLDHYTARIMHGNKVFQVKPQKQMFESLDVWLQTLPGQPTAADVRVEEHIRTPYDPAWKVPATTPWNPYLSKMYWPAYLYKVMMKYNANLKKNDELREAFHNLVNVLDQLKNNDCVVVVDYYTMMKNYHCVLIPTVNAGYDPWIALPVQIYRKQQSSYGGYQHLNRTNDIELAKQVYEAYKPLYDLMEKHGVLAWIRKNREENEKKAKAKQEERRKNQDRRILRRNLAKMQRMMVRFDAKAKQIESNKVYVQQQIQTLQSKLANL